MALVRCKIAVGTVEELRLVYFADLGPGVTLSLSKTDSCLWLTVGVRAVRHCYISLLVIIIILTDHNRQLAN